MQCRPEGHFPESPACLSSQQATARDANGIHTPSSALGQDTASKDDQWAAQQLAVDGEEVVGKVRLPQYLLLSRTLLTQPLGRQAQASCSAVSAMVERAFWWWHEVCPGALSKALCVVAEASYLAPVMDIIKEDSSLIMDPSFLDIP